MGRLLLTLVRVNNFNLFGQAFVPMLFILGMSFASQVHAGTCQPNLAAMDQQFMESLKQQVGTQKTRLALFAFQDGSQLPPDPTLQKAFPVVFYDLLSHMGKGRVLHPYLTLSASQQTPNEHLFNETILGPLAKNLGATHALMGLMQRLPNNQIRYFIKLVSLDKPTTTTWEFATEQGDRFFSVAVDAAGAVLSHLGVSVTKDIFQNYQVQNRSFEAFRYYVKGMEASMHYHEVDLEVAKAWFEKAAMHTYGFNEALLEKARTLMMLALIHKTKGNDISLLISEAGQTLSDPSLKSRTLFSPVRISAHRWVQAHENFVQATSLLSTGEYRMSQKLLEESLKWVPEDGLAHYYLGQAYQKSGHAQAGAQLTMASTLGVCP